MHTRLLFILLLAACSWRLSARHVKPSKFQRYWQASSLRVELLNAGIGMPPHFVNGRLHPGLQLGLQKPFRNRKRNVGTDCTLHLGYFAQQALQRSLYFQPGIGYSFNLYHHIQLRPMLNLALMGVQQINDEFSLNASGRYEKQNQFRFQCMPSIGFETSFPLAVVHQRPLSLSLGYAFGLQLPFSVISSVLPINQIHIGALLHPVNQKKK